MVSFVLNARQLFARHPTFDQLKLINRFGVIRLFKIFDVSLSFFPRKQYNALTVKSSVFSFFSNGLVSFKFIEPIVGDLQDPATIYHTV